MSDPVVWDSRSTTIVWRGHRIEVFYRGALAKALNREVVSIRAMEQRGQLCTPRLRTGPHPSGRWCYTRDQIEDLVQLAVDEGVINPKLHRPITTRFVVEAHGILQRLPRI